jgi:hypothetical protein
MTLDLGAVDEHLGQVSGQIEGQLYTVQRGIGLEKLA